MAITEVTFSRHAVEWMEERRISDSQVRRAVLQPDRVTVSGNRRIADRATDAGNLIRVVYTPRIGATGMTARVITVHRTTGG